jgi:uncharacterized protein
MLIAALSAVFAATALLYAAVGFGGGSTYTALLLLSGVAVAKVPIISLACNIIVVTGGSVRYALAQITPWRRAFPLVAIAAPLAFVGGLTPIKEGVLVGVLAGSLLVSAIILCVQPQSARPITIPTAILYVGSMFLAYLAGITGIGGGIFLAPLLHLIGWDSEARVAATASLFILANSLFGLGGQLSKGGLEQNVAALLPYWPLFVAVLIGGTVGSHFGVKTRSASLIRRLTGILVGVVAVRLIYMQLV